MTTSEVYNAVLLLLQEQWPEWNIETTSYHHLQEVILHDPEGHGFILSIRSLGPEAE